MSFDQCPKRVPRRSFLSASTATVASGLALPSGLMTLSQTRAAPAAQADGSQTKKVAVTIDDGPVSGAGNDLDAFIRISRGLREAFVTEKVPGIVFINERQLQVDGQRDARVRELERWLEDGLDIGNHTYSHKRLQRTPMREYKDDIIKGETVSRPLLEKHDKELQWFRYPFLNSGSGEQAAEVETFLKERGYRIAPVTVDYKDYTFARNYTRYMRAGEEALAAELMDSVWKSLDVAFDRSERESQSVLGYQVPHVLLIHCNEMNSVNLKQAFQRMRDRGYEFVSLEEAMTDPAYHTPNLPPGSMGGWVMSGLHAVK